MLYFLENEELIVRIDSYGAEVKSVLGKKEYREYMWYGDGKFWGRTSPVLFPFVGSLKNKKYFAKGKEYAMGQHGFARDMEFSFLDRTDNAISFVLDSNAETQAKYPYQFRLVIRYVLVENSLQVQWEVTNPGDEPMYFSIGAHPAFLCPVHGETTKAGYYLTFDDVKQIHHHGNTLDTGLACMEEDIVLPVEQGKVQITETFFDRCTYMIENHQTGGVGIADPQGNTYVKVTFDTPLFAIWSPEGKNAPFLCIEPWYGRCDATDFAGDITQRDYTNELAPGAQFQGGYTMQFGV